MLPSPDFAGFEDRGPILFDAATKSTVQKPGSYCKDLIGCGDPHWRQVQASATINDNTDCTFYPVGLITVKFTGLTYGGPGQVVPPLAIGGMRGYIDGLLDLMAPFYIACPPVVTP